MKIISKAGARTYSRDGIKSHLLVSGMTTGSTRLTTTLVEMEPDGVQRPHSHEQEQCYFILDGEGEMTVGDETASVGPGDCVYIPSNDVHGLRNTGGTVLRYYSAASPSWKDGDLRDLWPDAAGEETASP